MKIKFIGAARAHIEIQMKAIIRTSGIEKLLRLIDMLDFMSKTEENLKEAFAGESQANRKYLAFAERAEDENLSGVAKLFRAAAAAETVHAHKHLRTMKGVRSTKENLQEAIAGETHEFKSMYPQMIAEAKKEEERQAESPETESPHRQFACVGIVEAVEVVKAYEQHHGRDHQHTPRARFGIFGIEGRGVVPDIAVDLKRADLLAGRDTVLERAIEAIQPAKR